METLIASKKEIKEFAAFINDVHKSVLTSDSEREHAAFLILPMVRKKYWPNYPGNELDCTRILGRELVRLQTKYMPRPDDSDPTRNSRALADNFARQIVRLDAPEGAYSTQFRDGTRVDIPKMAMAVYVSLQPHDLIRGMSMLKNEFDSFLLESFEHNNSSDDPNPNYVKRVFQPSNMFMSCVHKSPCRNRVKLTDLDVDTKDEDDLRALVYFLSENARIAEHILFIVSTRGGYHLVIPSRKIGNKMGDLKKFCESTGKKNASERDGGQWCTLVTKNNVIPLPGTYQGGYHVQLVDPKSFLTRYDHLCRTYE